MMTFLEVLDDAVKIGLGGFVAWLITKGNRSHEFEKERRRRKQDCLERVIEDLGEQESAFDAWCSQCVATRKLKEANNSSAAAQSLRNANAKNETSEAARAKLMRSHSKLIVFGFDECAASLLAYHRKLLNLRVIVFAVQSGTKETESYLSGRPDVAKAAQDFREAVAQAFATF